MSLTIPAVPPQWPRGGNRFTRWLGRVVLRCWGWDFQGELPQRAPLVLPAAPHTSNWDFVFGMAAMLALGIRVSWMGKHTIFRRPFRGLLQRLGGIPVDRAHPGGVVASAVARLQERPDTLLALAPEGTRSRVEQWKSGFLRIAADAGVPLLPIAIDYRERKFVIGELFTPGSDLEADLVQLRAFFARYTAKYPQLAG